MAPPAEGRLGPAWLATLGVLGAWALASLARAVLGAGGERAVDAGVAATAAALAVRTLTRGVPPAASVGGVPPAASVGGVPPAASGDSGAGPAGRAAVAAVALLVGLGVVVVVETLGFAASRLGPRPAPGAYDDLGRDLVAALGAAAGAAAVGTLAATRRGWVRPRARPSPPPPVPGPGARPRSP